MLKWLGAERPRANCVEDAEEENQGSAVQSLERKTSLHIEPSFTPAPNAATLRGVRVLHEPAIPTTAIVE